MGTHLNYNARKLIEEQIRSLKSELELKNNAAFLSWSRLLQKVLDGKDLHELAAAFLIEDVARDFTMVLYNVNVLNLILYNCHNLEQFLMKLLDQTITKQLIRAIKFNYGKVKPDLFYKLVHFHVVPRIFLPTTPNSEKQDMIDLVFIFPCGYMQALMSPEDTATFKVNMRRYVTLLNPVSSINWWKPCQMLIRYCGKILHTDIEITNAILRVVEVGFKTKTVDDRCGSYDCWKELVENYHLDTTYLKTTKQIRLLIKPLNTKFSRNVTVLCKRFDAFATFIEKLENASSGCITDFLQFCFGPFDAAGEVDVNLSLSRLNINVFPKCTEVLLKLLGHKKGNCCPSAALNITNIYNITQFINNNNLHAHSHIFINSMRICSELCVNWASVEDRDSILKCMWSSLFMHLQQNIPEEQLVKIFSHLVQNMKRIMTICTEDVKFDGILQAVLKCLVYYLDCITYTDCINEHLVDPVTSGLCELLVNPGKNISKNKHTDSLEALIRFSLQSSSFLQRFQQILLALSNCKENCMFTTSFVISVLEKVDALYTPANKSTVIGIILTLLMWNFEVDSEEYDVIWKRALEMNSVAADCDVKHDMLDALKAAVVKKPQLVKSTLKIIWMVQDVLKESDGALYTKLSELICKCIDLPSFQKSSNFASSARRTLEIQKQYNFKPFPGFDKRMEACLLQPSARELTPKVVKKIAKISIEVIKTPTHSTRAARITNMAMSSPQSNVIRLFGQEVNTSSPVRVRGSWLDKAVEKCSPKSAVMLSPNTAKAKITPKKFDLNELDDNAFVPIDKEVKLDKSKLSEHQKEMLKKRRDDIPAMYQDLSQSISQTVDSSSQMEQVKACESVKESIRNKDCDCVLCYDVEKRPAPVEDTNENCNRESPVRKLEQTAKRTLYENCNNIKQVINIASEKQGETDKKIETPKGRIRRKSMKVLEAESSFKPRKSRKLSTPAEDNKKCGDDAKEELQEKAPSDKCNLDIGKAGDAIEQLERKLPKLSTVDGIDKPDGAKEDVDDKNINNEKLNPADGANKQPEQKLRKRRNSISADENFNNEKCNPKVGVNEQPEQKSPTRRNSISSEVVDDENINNEKLNPKVGANEQPEQKLRKRRNSISVVGDENENEKCNPGANKKSARKPRKRRSISVGSLDEVFVNEDIGNVGVVKHQPRKRRNSISTEVVADKNSNKIPNLNVDFAKEQLQQKARKRRNSVSAEEAFNEERNAGEVIDAKERPQLKPRARRKSISDENGVSNGDNESEKRNNPNAAEGSVGAGNRNGISSVESENDEKGEAVNKTEDATDAVVESKPSADVSDEIPKSPKSRGRKRLSGLPTTPSEKRQLKTLRALKNLQMDIVGAENYTQSGSKRARASAKRLEDNSQNANEPDGRSARKYSRKSPVDDAMKADDNGSEDRPTNIERTKAERDSEISPEKTDSENDLKTGDCDEGNGLVTVGEKDEIFESQPQDACPENSLMETNEKDSASKERSNVFVLLKRMNAPANDESMDIADADKIELSANNKTSPEPMKIVSNENLTSPENKISPSATGSSPNNKMPPDLRLDVSKVRVSLFGKPCSENAEEATSIGVELKDVVEEPEEGMLEIDEAATETVPADADSPKMSDRSAMLDSLTLDLVLEKTPKKISLNLLESENKSTPVTLIAADDITCSPVTSDTPTRNLRLIGDTVNISPIKTGDNPPVETPEAASKSQLSPDMFSSQEENVADEEKTSVDDDAVLRTPNSRSERMFNLLPKSIIAKPGSKRAISDLVVCNRVVSSPKIDRIRKMMMQCEGDKGEIREKDVSPNDVPTDQNVLKFDRELPSPYAKAKVGILKRKCPDIVEDGLSPAPKRKRVNFCDPPLTCSKYFYKDYDDTPSYFKPNKKKAASRPSRDKPIMEQMQNLANGQFVAAVRPSETHSVDEAGKPSEAYEMIANEVVITADETEQIDVQCDDNVVSSSKVNVISNLLVRDPDVLEDGDELIDVEALEDLAGRSELNVCTQSRIRSIPRIVNTLINIMDNVYLFDFVKQYIQDMLTEDDRFDLIAALVKEENPDSKTRLMQRLIRETEDE